MSISSPRETRKNGVFDSSYRRSSTVMVSGEAASKIKDTIAVRIFLLASRRFVLQRERERHGMLKSPSIDNRNNSHSWPHNPCRGPPKTHIAPGLLASASPGRLFTQNIFSATETLPQHDPLPQSSHPLWQQRPDTCTSAPPSTRSPSPQLPRFHEQRFRQRYSTPRPHA
jgi:hypothetical protein